MSSDKEDKSDKSDKASIYKRFFAYIVDGFIVMLVASLISAPFMDSKKVTGVSNDTITLMEKYMNKEITEESYLVDLSNMKYKMARTTELYTIFLIAISVLYYVIYPIYNNGQTIGKKIMKLRIDSLKGDLSANQLIIRSFIINGVLYNIISVLLLMFSSRNIYLNMNEELSFIQSLITVISMFMIVINKNGLSIHDLIAHTKVINYKE